MTGRLMKAILEHLDTAPELERECQIVRAIKGEQITNSSRITVHQSLKQLIKHGYVERHYEPQPYYEITNAGVKLLMKQKLLIKTNTKTTNKTPERGRENNNPTSVNFCNL